MSAVQKTRTFQKVSALVMPTRILSKECSPFEKCLPFESVRLKKGVLFQRSHLFSSARLLSSACVLSSARLLSSAHLLKSAHILKSACFFYNHITDNFYEDHPHTHEKASTALPASQEVLAIF